LNSVGLLIGSNLKEKAQAMAHANLAALSAAITMECGRQFASKILKTHLALRCRLYVAVEESGLRGKWRFFCLVRQHMNPCTYGRIICSLPANDLTPTSKKLILNTGEKASRQQSSRRNRRI
jgi:hypothetical protein